MGTRDRRDCNRGSDLWGAFCEFAHAANGEELKEAIEAAGENPDSLARQGRAIAEKILRQYAADPEGKSRKEREIKALHEGLSALLQLLRRREGLSQEALANKARVEIEEIRLIESDQSYMPNPRTIYQLEQMFGLPPRTLLKLSGMTASRSGEFAEQVMRFAANAKMMNSLTKAEKKILNEFMKFLISTDS